MTRQFNATPAKRQAVNLIVGLVGPSSSGKTYTALEMATGIQSVTGGDIDVIDTEHGRALFYADTFNFNHVPFEAPFASLDYLEAMKQSAKRGAKIIVVDSMSHEHESEGGMLDYQDQELTRMAGTDYGKRERMQMLAWAKPKAARRKLLQGLTQIDAHIILCFRAKQTSKPGKNDAGKNVVIPMGFMPIAGEEFVFEAALSMLFHPNARGVPTWAPEFPGERIAVKIPQQFEWMRGHQGPVNREVGRKLALWAQGGADNKASQPSQTRAQPQFDVLAWADRLTESLPSQGNLEALRRDWSEHKAELKAKEPDRFTEVNKLVAAKGAELAMADD